MYLRVSTTEQATRGGREEGFSIPAQRDANRRRADTLDADVVHEFVDAGETGTSIAKRPELQRMLAYIRDNPVDYCIVHKIDRLARSRADDVAINLALKQAGVTLVSTSENIDETPSGMLMHGIMSSIAEFYSRNLANEVTKGMTQKASLGGTVGRAPLGYRNVHRADELGRINRTVEIDPERAPHIAWAFYRYAEGDYSLSLLLEELTDRGLVTRPTPKQASKALTISTLHNILKSPYYKGEVSYRGVTYPGAHQPLVDAATWQQVQDLLAANNNAAVFERRNLSYLRGSVFCGDCDSRLLVVYAKNRHGTTYQYLMCSGRKRRVTDCTRQAMRYDIVEQLIEDEYRTIALSPELRDRVEELTLVEFDELQAADETKRAIMLRQQGDLTAKRQKLLEAHYAGAIPLDLLKTEQDRIATQLQRVQDQLARAETTHEEGRQRLAAVLDLARDCHAAYLEAPEPVRRLFNLAFFTRIYIDEAHDDARELTVRVDYNEPFDHLLSRLVPAHVHRDLTEKTRENNTARPGIRAGSDVTNSEATEGQGCPPSTLVELRGIEPRSSSAVSGLLRVQSVLSLFSAPLLAQTRQRQAQSGKSPAHPS